MYYIKNGNKYKNQKKEYNGVRYDSGAEVSYAQELELRKKAKDIKDWERQIRIPLVVNGYKVCDYIVDFKVIHNDGSEELVEIKGLMLPVSALKIKLFEASYLHENPHVSYTLIKQNGDLYKRFKLKKMR